MKDDFAQPGDAQAQEDVAVAEQIAEAPPPNEDGRVRFVRDGQLVSVPADRAQEYGATNPGARPATAEEMRAAQLRRENSGIGAELQTFAEGAASGLTLGASDVVAGAVGGDETRDAMRARREANPLAGTAGTIGGALLPALLTGGGSAGASGAVAAGRAASAARGVGAALRASPAGLVARGALGAERAVHGAVASRAAAMATAGAVEGLAFGAGEAISDAALSADEQDRTAERLMAAIADRAGSGAILGAITGGALGGLASGAAAGGRKVQDLAGRLRKGAGKADGAAPESAALSAALGAGDEAHSALRGTVDAADRSPLTRMIDEASASRALPKVRDEAKSIVTREVAGLADLDDMARVYANVGMKRDNVVSGFARAGRGDDGLVLNQTAGVLGEVQDALAATRNVVTDAEPAVKRVLSRASKKVDAYIEQMDAVTRRGMSDDAAADLFVGLDQLKRTVGQDIASATRSRTGAIDLAGDLNDQVYEPLRRLLEDASVWGDDAAALQRETNASWTKFLDYSDSLRRNLLKTADAKSAANPFAKRNTADPAKISALVDGLGDFRVSGDAASGGLGSVERSVVEGTREQAALMNMLQKHYQQVPPDLARKLSSARESAKRIEDAFGRVKRVKADEDAWKGRIGAMDGMPVTLKEVLGFRDAALVGMGSVRDKVTKLTEVMARADSAKAKLHDAARRIVRGGVDAAKGAARGIPGAAVAGRGASGQREFGRVYSALSEYERDPMAATSRAVRMHGDMSGYAPNVGLAYRRKTAQAAKYLLDKLPPSSRHTTLGFARDPDEVPDVSPADAARFMRSARAVEDPLTVLDDAANGRLTLEAVEAVREVYPMLYADMQDEVMQALSDADKPPSYATRIQLGILFGIPTDSTLEPEYLRWVQGQAQASPQEGGVDAVAAPSARSPLGSGKDQMSASMRLAGGV